MTTTNRPDASTITDAHLAQLYTERDQFADRVDTLTAVCKSNKRAHQILAEDHQRLERELAAARTCIAAVRALAADMRITRGVLGRVLADQVDAALDGQQP